MMPAYVLVRPFLFLRCLYSQMLKTMRMIQQAAPMPAMKAGCFTTSEIC